MDPFLARTMIESLSKGISPLTGQVLPDSDSCANEEIQDALLEVLAHCSIESTEQYLVRLKNEKAERTAERRARNAQRFPRGGEPWTHEEESKLLHLHRNGYSIYHIANILKRTPSAVAARMKELQYRPLYRTSK